MQVTKSHICHIFKSYIHFLAQKTVAPVLKTLRNPPDTVNDYKAEYGYLGPQLQVAVVKARQAPPSTATTLTAPIRAITPTTTRIIQQGETFFQVCNFLQ